MVTGAIKNKVDKIWTDIWAGGITNPLTVIEQLTYLMFIRSLDEKELETEKFESMTGEKMAKEGTWDAFIGTWIATFILFPISFYLTYKATSDSNLFNAEWYQIRIHRLRDRIVRLFHKGKNKIKTK